MDVPIKVVKNFINKEEIYELTNYIDFLEQNELESFAIYQDGKRLALQFGKDECHGDTSMLNLNILKENKDLISLYMSKVIEETKHQFNVKSPLYVCSFWLAKQYSGASIPSHEDTDSGYNMHFKYSGIVYLNTMVEGGALHFLDLGYTHSPEAGDLVLFPSQGTGNHEVLDILETRYSFPIWMTDTLDMAISVESGG
jgi:hypothetical protein